MDSPVTRAAEGAVMIDMRLMDDVHVDLPKRSVRIRPGALGGNIIRETAPYGLSPVTGMAAEIGYGGIGLMGGFGYRSPRYGTTCDNLLSVDLVLADGSWVTASPVANPDLFWAVRGAGDNFGVVTSFEAMLHPIPPDADVLTLLWDPQRRRGAAAEVPRDRAVDVGGSLLVARRVLLRARSCGTGHLVVPPRRARRPSSTRWQLLTALAELGTVVHHEVKTMPYEDMYYLPLHGADWFDTTRAYIGYACLREPRTTTRRSRLFISQAQELAGRRRRPGRRAPAAGAVPV